MLPICWNRAVQDEEGNDWVSQNAWEHSESLQEVFSSSLGKKKNLCWVTHLEAMNLFPKRRSFPLTCCVQGCVCPAQAAPVGGCYSLPCAWWPGWKSLIPVCPCSLSMKPRALLRAVLLQGPGIPERHCVVCPSLSKWRSRICLAFRMLISFLLGSCSNNQIPLFLRGKLCLWLLILDHARACQGREEIKWRWKYLIRQPGNLSGVFPALLCSLCTEFLQSPG